MTYSKKIKMEYKKDNFFDDLSIGHEMGIRFRNKDYHIWSLGNSCYIALEEGGEIVWTEKNRDELSKNGRIDGELIADILDEIEIIDFA